MAAVVNGPIVAGRDDVQEAQERFVVEAVEIPGVRSADGRNSLPAGH